MKNQKIKIESCIYKHLTNTKNYGKINMVTYQLGLKSYECTRTGGKNEPETRNLHG